MSFSEDQSLLLYSVANANLITVGTINIHDHQQSYFTIDASRDLEATEINRVPQAICASADHSLIALSCSLKGPDFKYSTIFIVKNRVPYTVGKGLPEGVKLLKFSTSAELLVAVSEQGRVVVYRVLEHMPVLPENTDAPLQEEFCIVDQYPTQGRITKVEFTEDCRRLKTNLGYINLFDPDKSPAVSGLHLDKNWICMAGKSLMYLPPDYRPDLYHEKLCFPCNYGSVIQDSFVWIKTVHFGLVMIEFDLDLIRKLIRDGKLV